MNYREQVSHLKELRFRSKRSWINIHTASRYLQGLSYAPFGTSKEASSSLSLVRKIVDETGLTLSQIETIAARKGDV